MPSLLHAFDAELMVKTTGNLTQSVSTAAKKLWGLIAEGLAFQIVVPSANGANDTIDFNVYHSADDSTYNLVSHWHNGATKVPTGGMVCIVPFPVHPGKGYYKLEMVVTVASTTVNYGAVIAGIIPNPGHEWDRTNHWEL